MPGGTACLALLKLAHHGKPHLHDVAYARGGALLALESQRQLPGRQLDLRAARQRVRRAAGSAAGRSTPKRVRCQNKRGLESHAWRAPQARATRLPRATGQHRAALVGQSRSALLSTLVQAAACAGGARRAGPARASGPRYACRSAARSSSRACSRTRSTGPRAAPPGLCTSHAAQVPSAGPPSAHASPASAAVDASELRSPRSGLARVCCGTQASTSSWMPPPAWPRLPPRTAPPPFALELPRLPQPHLRCATAATAAGLMGCMEHVGNARQLRPSPPPSAPMLCCAGTPRPKHAQQGCMAARGLHRLRGYSSSSPGPRMPRAPGPVPLLRMPSSVSRAVCRGCGGRRAHGPPGPLIQAQVVKLALPLVHQHLLPARTPLLPTSPQATRAGAASV